MVVVTASVVVLTAGSDEKVSAASAVRGIRFLQVNASETVKTVFAFCLRFYECSMWIGKGALGACWGQ